MSNFYTAFETAARANPERVAIEVVRAAGVDTWSYADLEKDAMRWAAWLHAQGVAAGDRCAILADNDARWIGAYLGALRLGAVAVPLDTNYKASQVRTVADNCDARVLFHTAKYAKTAAEAAPNRTRVDIYAGADARPATPPPPVAERSADDAAVMLYTSGTTSDPKGVILTHGNLAAERTAAFSTVPVTKDDAVLGVLPLFHALAQLANLLLPLAVGGRVVFLETVSSTSLLAALQERGITIFACVPQFFYLIHQRVTAEVAKKGALTRAIFNTMLRTNGWLRDHMGWNPGERWFARVHHTLGKQMRVLLTGGSKFDPVIGRALYDLGFNLQNAYGLTECTGGATIMTRGEKFNTSVGKPLTGVEIRIQKDNGPKTQDDDHADGEILIRGPVVMKGYYNRPDANAETLKDGWLHTGDLGYLDAEGRLFITGRKKEIIVLSSGKNLYPEEIEAHYRQSPFIKEICVLGLTQPGQPSAERLHAVVVLDEDILQQRKITNVRELVRFELESQSVGLPAHKRVLSYDVWMDPLPRTSTSKVRRHEVERLVRERAAGSQAGANKDEGPAKAESPEERAWLEDADRGAARADAMSAIRARLERPSIRPDASLELDLTLDSMERVELVTMLEQRAGTTVAPEQRASIFTVRQLVDAVLAGAASEGAAGATPWETILRESHDDAIAHNLGGRNPVRAAAFFLVLRTINLLAKIFVGFRSDGQEHLPKTGPLLICPNHQSYLDGLFLTAALPYRHVRDMFFVGASEYFQSPFTKWFARFVNIIPVDPDANLVTAMRAGAAGLRLGKALIIFPEGERSIDGELKPFRKGSAILSGSLGVPIVPVALDGIFTLWPRSRPFQWHRLLPWRREPVHVRFGPPLTVPPGEYTEGTAALRSSVDGLFTQLKERKS